MTISYILNSSLCLLALFLFFRIFLEPERMHGFNRFFILLALVLGLSLPALDNFRAIPSLKVEPNEEIAGISAKNIADLRRTPIKMLTGTVFPIGNGEKPALITEAPALPVSDQNTRPIPWMQILFFTYISGVIFLLLKYGHGIYKLLTKARQHEFIQEGTTRIILMDEEVSPHTFMDYIFVNKEEYESGHINQQILDHERAHIRGFHTLDLLLVEFLKIVFWFNPGIHLFRRALLVNHEYWADEQVIKKEEDVTTYQNKLIEVALTKKQELLASNLNFFLTKKRMLMMTRKISRLRHSLKKLMLTPVLPLLFLMYGIFDPDLESSSWSTTPSIELTADTVQVSDDMKFILAKDPSGDYFTGTQKVFDHRNGMLRSEQVYENGVEVEFRVYNPLGQLNFRSINELEDGFIRTTNQYLRGRLMSIRIHPHPNYGPEGHDLFFNEEGNLIYENYYLSDPLNFHGLETEYSESGDILQQRRFENGKLVETIK